MSGEKDQLPKNEFLESAYSSNVTSHSNGNMILENMQIWWYIVYLMQKMVFTGVMRAPSP